jgi:malate permease and related proteins
MEIFLELYKHLLPYLLFIPLGIGMGKLGWLNSNWISKPLIWFFMPLLVIFHVQEADEQNLVSLAGISFSLASLMILPAIWMYNRHKKKSDLNLLKSCFSFYNVAFFGIPTVQSLFGEESVTLLICIYVGTALYGDLVGYYQVARSGMGKKEALKRVVRAPFLYAFFLAVLLKIIGVPEFPEIVKDSADLSGTIVSVAGMFIIGLNASSIKLKSLDYSFLGKINLVRFLAGALIMASILGAEYFLVEALEEEAMQMLMLLPLFPVAANVTVFASFLNTQEKESAMLILNSLLLSLLLVPLVASFF